MYTKLTQACVLTLVSILASPLPANEPSGEVAVSTRDVVDPFAPTPSTDRFHWRSFVSVKRSIVSGHGIVSAITPMWIELASGSIVNTDEKTVVVRKSPGGTPVHANRERIAVGAPVSFEVDMERGAAASRIVVWNGFGPNHHKIYDERIMAVTRTLENRGLNQQMVKLEDPTQQLQIQYADQVQVIPPGVPQLIQLDEPRKSIDMICGTQRKTVSAAKEFTAVVAFRSYGNLGMLLLVD